MYPPTQPHHQRQCSSKCNSEAHHALISRSLSSISALLSALRSAVAAPMFSGSASAVIIVLISAALIMNNVCSLRCASMIATVGGARLLCSQRQSKVIEWVFVFNSGQIFARTAFPFSLLTLGISKSPSGGNEAAWGDFLLDTDVLELFAAGKRFFARQTGSFCETFEFIEPLSAAVVSRS